MRVARPSPAGTPTTPLAPTTEDSVDLLNRVLGEPVMVLKRLSDAEPNGPVLYLDPSGSGRTLSSTWATVLSDLVARGLQLHHLLALQQRQAQSPPPPEATPAAPTSDWSGLTVQGDEARPPHPPPFLACCPTRPTCSPFGVHARVGCHLRARR